MRQVLLAAHVLPACFGLITVAAERGEAVRGLNYALWAIVVAWTLFLLVFGWRRTAGGVGLTAWVAADALLMAALMFVGTPARTVVSYVAVDGALFAAVFLSTPIALAQVALVYGALGAAALARADGATLPSPIVGWQTPLVVTLAGILALRFLRSALDRLDEALLAQEQALARAREAAAEAAANESLIQSASLLEGQVIVPVGELGELAREYVRLAPSGEARREADWVLSCTGRAQAELDGLERVLTERHDEPVAELVRVAVRSARETLAVAENVACAVKAGEEVRLPEREGRAVAGFVREAVVNALVHGRPPVRVKVTRDPEEIRISVDDAGEGYEESSVGPGIGTEAMRTHAHAVGGRIERRREAAGHSVALVLPGPR